MHLSPETPPLGALVSVIHRTHDMIINERMRAFGLSSGQLFTLIHLAHQQGVTQETLARRFHVDKGTTARAVRRLEDTGHIIRTTDPDDRRAVRIFLTKKGEEIIPEIIRIDREWEKDVCAGLTDEEQRAVYTLLQTIARNSITITQENEDARHRNKTP
ncbi:DNA-binding MarR family transcriptional regulator [Methanofollis sp. W23]|uniref:MarR family winged helix-turn-helix transcriptional regulator n=1 Tax=Methanofollis sp. W23 TaxID=2817849 RepID=UPI001AE2CF71|nr:MarR family transcriptional regulator [Methanofollis sp. W23]MBP2147159.1 DNA-binding MarR family transcriptional regulator [Methanofollis sp. W23]